MNICVRISLRGTLRLIRVDTLRSVHNVGFLVGQLMRRFLDESLELFPHLFPSNIKLSMVLQANAVRPLFTLYHLFTIKLNSTVTYSHYEQGIGCFFYVKIAYRMVFALCLNSNKLKKIPEVI